MTDKKHLRFLRVASPHSRSRNGQVAAVPEDNNWQHTHIYLLPQRPSSPTVASMFVVVVAAAAHDADSGAGTRHEPPRCI